MAARGSVVGAPSASMAQLAGSVRPSAAPRRSCRGRRRCWRCRAPPGRGEPPGVAIDQGLAPTVFSRPPHGAIAGLPLVVRMPTQPVRGHAAGPVGGGAEVVAVADRDHADAVLAGAPDRLGAGAVGDDLTDPVAAVEHRDRAARRRRVSVSVTGRITPDRRRATYQSRRSMPCEGWPHRSAVTRLSLTSRASGSGYTDRAAEPRRRRSPSLGVEVGGHGRLLGGLATAARIAGGPARRSATCSSVSGRVAMALQQQEEPGGLLELLDGVGGRREVVTGDDGAVVGEQEGVVGACGCFGQRFEGVVTGGVVRQQRQPADAASRSRRSAEAARRPGRRPSRQDTATEWVLCRCTTAPASGRAR